MQRNLLPLFPLPSVLLPHNDMPLHIFEERYKEMIGAAIRDKSEFGIVLAASGGIASEGCSAAVRDVVQRYPDGRLDIMAVGLRRFRVQSLDQELEFLRGEVEFFEDDLEAESTSELRKEAVDACATFADAGSLTEASATDLSFRLATHFSDVLFRQQLLSLRSESERLRRIIAYAPGYKERGRESVRMRDLAPKNGHGKHPPGLPEE